MSMGENTMNTQTKSLRCMMFVLSITLLTLCLISYSYAQTDEKFSIQSRQEIEKQCDESIKSAEKLFIAQQYADALRLLYDTHKQEQEIKLPLNAHYKIYREILSLIHENQSPFMEYLRDKEISIEQKNEVLSDLKKLAMVKDNERQNMSLKQQYTGPLIELLISPHLATEEKQEIVKMVMTEIRENYISEEQKKEAQKNINQNLKIADQKFQDENYADAFQLIFESSQKAQDAGITSYSSVNDALFEKMDFFANHAQSPLMNFLRNQEIVLKEKQEIFIELETLAKGGAIKAENVFLREANEGGNEPLLSLMKNHQLDVDKKRIILGWIKDVIEKEYTPLR